MANGTKKIGWLPANDAEEEKAERGEVYQGQDGNFYQHENIAEASRKNPPVAATPEPPKSAAAPAPAASTPPEASGKVPSAADLDAVAAEQQAKNDTATKTGVQMAAPPSFQKPAPQGAPSDLGYDADKMDSTGKNKKDGVSVGPRGKDAPLDALSDAERAARTVAADAKQAIGSAATHLKDSAGKLKGSFKVTPQGVDKNGAKIPDKVDYDSPTAEFQPVHGPRGVGAPKDTFSR